MTQQSTISVVVLPSSAHAPRGLYGQLVERLGDLIVAGGVKPDDLVQPEQIGTAYGVSRTVVREALRVLENKGLISARPGVGTRIRPVEQWNLLDADVLRWRGAVRAAEPVDVDIAVFTDAMRGMWPKLGGNLLYELLMENLTGIPRTQAAADDPQADPHEAAAVDPATHDRPLGKTTVHAKRAPHWDIPLCDFARTGDLVAMDDADTVTCPACLTELAADVQPQPDTTAEPDATLAEAAA